MTLAEEREFIGHRNDMATWFLWSAFENWCESNGWEDVPEIGEYDYERIVEAAQKLLTPDITIDRYQAALGYFAKRAEKEET